MVRQKLSIASDTTVIASVGQLIPAKDRMTLLKSISILNNRQLLDNVLFILEGDGVERPMLENYVRENRFELYVRFLHGSFDVEALFNIASFMVLSSVREGLPYVLLEAGSLDKPHIATNVGGVGEFITHNVSGILVEPGRPEELAQAFEHFIRQPEIVQRMGSKAREKFEQQFTFGRFVDETLDVYRSCLSK